MALGLGYWGHAGELARERAARVEQINLSESQAEERLNQEVKRVEGDYRQKLASIQASLARVRAERDALAVRLNRVEESLRAVTAQRQEVLSHVYSQDELDRKFTAILARGKPR